jgi:hypothetical protein
MLRVARLRLGKTLDLLAAGLARVLLVQRDEDHIAFDRRFESLRLVEVEHHARAITRLDDVEAPQRGFVHRTLRGAEAIGRVQEIECNARRTGNGKTRRRIGRRILELEADDRPAGRGLQHRDLLDGVRALGRHTRRHDKHAECGQRGRPFSSRGSNRAGKQVAG